MQITKTLFQFISLLLLLLTLEGLICVLGLLYQPSIHISLRTVLQQRMIQDYGREGYEAFTEAIDFTQYKFSCCGVVSPTDYQNSVTTRWRWALLHPSSESRLEVPRTCCKLINAEVNKVGTKCSFFRHTELGSFHRWKTIPPVSPSLSGSEEETDSLGSVLVPIRSNSQQDW